MRIALVAAGYDRDAYRGGESLGLQYLAASLQADGHEVMVYDLGFSAMKEECLLKALADGGFGLVGFGILFTRNLPRTLDLARAVRRACPGTHLCVGGQGTSFVWKEVLDTTSCIDTSVCFEGELTVCELARALEKGDGSLGSIRGLWWRGQDGPEFTGFREPITEVDSIPLPRRCAASRVEGQPHFMVLSSRGCSAHCTFCGSGSFGNKYHRVDRWRPRSVANVMAEVQTLTDEKGARALSFVDDDLLGGAGQGKGRARQIAQELVRRGRPVFWSMECRADEIDGELLAELRDAGLRNLLIGFDAGNVEDLRLFGKQTTIGQAQRAVAVVSTLGLSLEAGFIPYHPLTTMAHVRENLRFVADLGIGGYQVLTNRLHLYAGSPLVIYFGRHVELKRQGFMYSYEISDWRVRILRDALVVGLRPLQRLEERAERVVFAAQTGLRLANDGRTTEPRVIEGKARELRRRIGEAHTAVASVAASCVAGMAHEEDTCRARLDEAVDSEVTRLAAALLTAVVQLEEEAYGEQLSGIGGLGS